MNYNSRELCIARLKLLGDVNTERLLINFLQEWELVGGNVTRINDIPTKDLQAAIEKFHRTRPENICDRCGENHDFENCPVRSDVKVKFKGRSLIVDDLWDQFRDYMGFGGYDVACYICDGVSVWPCGRMVDSKENTGTEYCECDRCNSVRSKIG